MKIVYHPKFIRMFKKLPRELQEKAVSKEDIFRSDIFDPRLKTHKLNPPLSEYWAFWIDYRYRIIFKFTGPKEVYFYMIGDHSIYE